MTSIKFRRTGEIYFAFDTATEKKLNCLLSKVVLQKIHF
jgi:hypothetical protein